MIRDGCGLRGERVSRTRSVIPKGYEQSLKLVKLCTDFSSQEIEMDQAVECLEKCISIWLPKSCIKNQLFV